MRIKHQSATKLFNFLIKLKFDLKLLMTFRKRDCLKLFQLLRFSKAQLRQDLFVLSELRFKREGYFVEFGAANGRDLSNTFLLENDFSWKGILAEPSRFWHNDLFINRSNSIIDTKCVWSASDVSLEFHETTDPELSTIKDFQIIDPTIKKSQSTKSYFVSTISLLDLLRTYGAPKHIDYLSLDTEGSEYEILKSFDFSEYSFGTISCEHNYKPIRNDIHKLLTSNGYSRKWEKLSLFDDWYVKDTD